MGRLSSRQRRPVRVPVGDARGPDVATRRASGDGGRGGACVGWVGLVLAGGPVVTACCSRSKRGSVANVARMVQPRAPETPPRARGPGPGMSLFRVDPPFHWRVWTTVPESGYLLEQITSLGTHTGTHISAPCHFHVGARCLVHLSERFFTPRPLVVIDLRSQIRRRGGDFFVAIGDLHRFESAHGRIPPGSYVVLYTGLSRFYHLGNRRRPGPANDYFD